MEAILNKIDTLTEDCQVKINPRPAPKYNKPGYWAIASDASMDGQSLKQLANSYRELKREVEAYVGLLRQVSCMDKLTPSFASKIEDAQRVVRDVLMRASAEQGCTKEVSYFAQDANVTWATEAKC